MGGNGDQTRWRWTAGLALLVLIAVVSYYSVILYQPALSSRIDDGRQDRLTQLPRIDRLFLRTMFNSDRRPAQKSPDGASATATASSEGTAELATADPPEEEPASQPDEAYADIERAIAEQTKPAEAVIEVDSEMQMGRDYTASLIIEGGDGSNIESITVSTPEPVATELEIEIASSAAAYVASSAFEIEPMSPTAQSIRTGAPTIWRWRLTPKQAGDADLMFILMQSILANGEIRSYPVRQFPQNVRVSLSWWLWGKELALSTWGVLTAMLVAGASIATILHSWHEVRKARREAPLPPPLQGPPQPTTPPRGRQPIRAKSKPKVDAVERIRADAHKEVGVKEE